MFHYLDFAMLVSYISNTGLRKKNSIIIYKDLPVPCFLLSGIYNARIPQEKIWWETSSNLPVDSGIDSLHTDQNYCKCGCCRCRCHPIIIFKL